MKSDDYRIMHSRHPFTRVRLKRTHSCVVQSRTRHYSDVIVSSMASQFTGVLIGCSTVCSCTDQRKHSSASLAFVRGIHRSPVDSPHKGPVTRKMFPFDGVIMQYQLCKGCVSDICISEKIMVVMKGSIRKVCFKWMWFTAFSPRFIVINAEINPIPQ